MDSTVAGVPEQTAPSEHLSPLQRLGAIFTRPSRAWGGLKEHSQWWFPLLIVGLVSALSAGILHNRAIVPMVAEGWDQAVQDGKMTAEQADKMEGWFSGPAGLAIGAAQQFVIVVVLTLLMGLAVHFGVGFILGTKLRFRLALEVAAWSSMVTLPTVALATVMGWVRQTMRGVHSGFGVLLPDSETPSKLTTGLGVFLDGIGPLSVWYLIVLILGASALSGAPRRSVAWTLTALYLVFVAIGAALAATFTPAA